jgi:hypothetical protein
MELKQKRHSNRIGYVFGEDEVQYSVQDGSGSRTFSVDYTDISRDRQTLEERNAWLRNVGLLWIAIGVFGTGMTWFSEGALKVSFWLWVGGLCYLAYRLRSTKFVILPSDRGNLLVIDDATGATIVQELETRRAAKFRRDYDGFREDEENAQQRQRFSWLHREGALSDDELQQRLGMLDVAIEVDAARDGTSQRPVLN